MGKVSNLTKRPGTSAAKNVSKGMKASSTAPIIKPGGGSSSAARLSSFDEHIHLYVQVFCRNGSIHSANFTNGKLLLVKMVHGRRPSALFKVHRWVQMYFDQGHDDTLTSWDDFLESFGAHYVWTGGTPRVYNDVKFGKNLSGFFVSEKSFKDWLMMLDELLDWRTKFSNEELEKLPAAPSVRVHLPEDMELSFDQDDALKCDMAVATEGSGDSFIFDFPHPKSGQLLVMELEPKSNSIGNIYIGGNTWPFKEAFDNLSIPFQYQQNEFGDSVLVRLITNVDFAKTEDVKRILQQILDTLEESPVVLRLQSSTFSPDLFLEAMEVADDLSFVRVEK